MSPRDQEGSPSITSKKQQPESTRHVCACVPVCVRARVFSVLNWTTALKSWDSSPYRSLGITFGLEADLGTGKLSAYANSWSFCSGAQQSSQVSCGPFSLGVWFNLISFVISDSVGYQSRNRLPWSETQCFIANIKKDFPFVETSEMAF